MKKLYGARAPTVCILRRNTTDGPKTDNGLMIGSSDKNHVNFSGLKRGPQVVIDEPMKAFTQDEIELLLQGLGILRDVYEEIVDEGRTVHDPHREPSTSCQLANVRLTRTRELIVKCRQLTPK
nr:Unknown Function [uncultured bacterium]